jgi:hypothetical protein
MEDAIKQATPLADIALVGAVASVEEAMQMHQMRFILMWSMRVQCLAPKPEREPPLDLAALLSPALARPQGPEAAADAPDAM